MSTKADRPGSSGAQTSHRPMKIGSSQGARANPGRPLGASATRITVTALGLLSAAVGVEHGLGAIEQGAEAPPGLVFRSWPDAAAFDALGGEPALTLVPNLLLTGVLAVLISVAIGVWTIWGAHHPRWGAGLMALSILQLVCGGGFGPPVIGLVGGLLATRVGHTYTTSGGRATKLAARLWPWPLVLAVASFLMLVPGFQFVFALNGSVSPELVGLVTLAAFASTALAVASARAADRLAGAAPA
jgi:hypothetical protein